jgi:early secretory antigenic target protein ESAT-6
MGQDGVIQVDYGSLEMGATALLTASKALEQNMSDLDGALAPTMSSWDGDAKEAFLPHQATWKTAAQDLSTKIISLKGAVDWANEHFQSTERANSL